MARLRITLHRSFATRRLQVGNAVAAAAMAVCVSTPFMPGALAIASPVAGLTTCTVEARQRHGYVRTERGTAEAAGGVPVLATSILPLKPIVLPITSVNAK